MMGLKKDKGVRGTQETVVSSAGSSPSLTMTVERMAWAPALPPQPAILSGSISRSAACARTQRTADRASAAASIGVAIRN